MSSEKEVVQIEQVAPSPTSTIGLTESTLLKLVEYGGFVAAILALCLFFVVLTEFVKRVKED